MRVGLTQRVELVASYGERRDCLDQRWTLLAAALGVEPVPLPNRVEDVSVYLDQMKLDACILTGGNDLAQVPDASNAAPERDRFEASLVAHCRERRTPVVGVCRGMQFLNALFGGQIEACQGHVATRHEVRAVDAPGVFEAQAFSVNSYHGYGLSESGLGDGLVALAVDPSGGIEALRHCTEPISGVMWHPEREDPFQSRDLGFLRVALRGELS